MPVTSLYKTCIPKIIHFAIVTKSQGMFELSHGSGLGFGPNPYYKLTSAPSGPCARDISTCYNMRLNSNKLRNRIQLEKKHA